MSKEKIKKENFTDAKKNPGSSFLNEILYENLPSKSNLIQLFRLFFIAFEHLSLVLTFGTLSSLYINGSEKGCAHLPEILISIHGTKLKLGPVIDSP